MIFNYLRWKAYFKKAKKRNKLSTSYTFVIQPVHANKILSFNDIKCSISDNLTKLF